MYKQMYIYQVFCILGLQGGRKGGSQAADDSRYEKDAYGRDPRSHLSCCCAKNILANTLNRKAGHRMISFYVQSLTGCTCSEVCRFFENHFIFHYW